MPMIELLVCDDSDEARAALRTMLAEHEEIAIVGEARNGDEGVERALELRPDVVLMDLHMPIVDGVEATRRIAKLLPSTRVVAYSAADDSGSVRAMTEAGAAAYCVKGSPIWELERAIAGRSEPLVRLAAGIAKATNRTSIGSIVCRELLELAEAGAAAAYIGSVDGGLSLAGCAGSARARRLASAPGLALDAFTSVRPVHAALDDLRELAQLGLHCSSALAVPLLADGEVLGALLVTMPPDSDLVADVEFVADIAGLAASAFASERRLALTYAEARRDALTGVGNRRALDERLEAALREAAGAERELAVVLFDLDDFKRYNDEGGHAVGDAVLAQVARAATRVLRAGEELYRYGGDEFALVVEGGDEAGYRVADRIQDALATHTRGGSMPSISAGVATFPYDARTPVELLAAADDALYASKRAGKSRVSRTRRRGGSRAGESRGPADTLPPAGPRGPRLLFVDDDPALLTLLQATFELIDVEIDVATTAADARAAIGARPPDVLVLDIGLPDVDGLTLCRSLKDDPATSWIGVVLLTGMDEAEGPARQAGADALLRKPFSPLELLSVVERLAGGLGDGPFEPVQASTDEQVLRYASDLRRLLEIERGRRALLQRSYEQTVVALAGALESKDWGTALHSQRVQRYAVELAREVEAGLLRDPSVEYGFLLHDVGKIAIPDHVLQKPGPLDDSELRLMRTHTLLGEQLLRDVDLLHGDGLRVVRGHHERWDGLGYPDGLGGHEIPLAARIFTVADVLDAITTDRPYRAARSWDDAAAEILAGRGRQFDPDVVDAFVEREAALRGIRVELAAA
ncbi:MAG: response regulator [Thermoleophilia bacterium]|nr:response regulator [Thermoleophilia bacterium]